MPRRVSPPPILVAALLGAALHAAPSLAADAPAPDPVAVDLAESTMEAMGGREAWEATRYVQWTFLGKRRHHWDRRTGDVRIEAGDRLVLMNVGTREGRAWEGGEEIVDPDARRAALDEGYAWWVNDSYWLIMPWKLRDPGTRLAYVGEDALPDGRAADVLDLTFDPGTGLTPRNRYRLWIARDTGLVEQWSFRADADDPEPRFTLPWAGWTRIGAVRFATDRGRGHDWEIAAPEELPRELFERP